jgi:hypothetical protein
MSFGGQQVQSFFGPLSGKTTTFLLDGRDTNLSFARTLLGLLARTGEPGTVLDLDAFYSSNADIIFPSLPRALAESTSIRVPEPGTDIEGEVASLFGSTQKLLIVDSLNSLYHLISLEDGSSRSRKLSFAIAGLSYLARTSGKVVVVTMYRREGFTRSGPGRSISALSDVTASVEARGDGLIFRVERGQAWPGGRYSTRIL